MPGNPLPSDGLVGKLTPEQTIKLREFWAEFFKLVNNAPKTGTQELPDGGGPGTGADAKDAKAAGKDIPKDDAAKERMRAEQELKDAKAALEKYGSDRFMATYWRTMMMDDPDVLVLKFLRARKWDVPAGVAMLAAMMKWRMESDVEKIVMKGEEGLKEAEGFINQMASGKTYIQGTDKMGRPVVYIHVKLHKLFDQSAKALEDFVIFSMEAVRSLLTPPLVEKATIVFDMTSVTSISEHQIKPSTDSRSCDYQGFGLANMDWKCVLFIVKCLEAYYPESLNVMIIHNPPWVFQGIWKILSPMLDPVVRAKIQMTKSTDDLLQHIDSNHLVKQLGGTSEWKWEYTPIAEGENEIMSDTKGKKREIAHREKLCAAYEEVTKRWMKDGGEDLERLRKFVMLSMRVQYFKLDPYLRGRSVYHRHGNIVGNGLVSFEYPGIQNGPPEGEWEVLGYPLSREQLEVDIERLKKRLEKDGVEVPDLEPGPVEKKKAEEVGEEVEGLRKGVKPRVRSSSRRRKVQESRDDEEEE